MRNQLQILNQSNEGKEKLKAFLMLIEQRASLNTASAAVGINPKTMSNWLARGKKEAEGEYKELWDNFVRSVGAATVSAELEVNEIDPKFYLQRGFGKLLVGDLYNYVGTGKESYNIDGTINVEGETTDKTIKDDDDLIDANSIKEDNHDRVNRELTLEGLKALRDAGESIDELIDNLILDNKNKSITQS